MICVTMGYKGVLARVSSITAWSVQDDDPVNNQIVGIGLTTPKHYYVPDLEQTRVLTPNHYKRSNRQHAVTWRTHTSRRDNQNRIFRVKRQADSAPKNNCTQDDKSDKK